ncbi:MAG: GTP-binding protein [Nitrospirae bacterium RBG_13_39_12]|nr:MAG: GTP-binding protein [Nitrospirae bacterium RBG_13_39_12]
MEKRYKYCIIILFIMLFLSIPICSMGLTVGYTTGKVVDIFTKNPIKEALVTINTDVVLTDEEGTFSIKTSGDKLAVRAYGYMRTEQKIPMTLVISPTISIPVLIELVPFTPKALYLTVFGIGDNTLRGSALKLIDETELNSLVIDVKGDRGIVNYRSSVPVVSEIGSRLIIIKDLKGMIKSLKEKGIYTIARIVVFKDNPLALAKPDLALKTRNGEIWNDKEGLAWVNPFKKEVWDYNIDIAIEAAQSGFDEIQFDYVRFPDEDGLEFSMPNTEENRVKAITGFLAEARKRLTPYNVFLAADIFGYVFWNLNDTYIGQKLEELSLMLDYTSPMLYPSGFRYGIPGYRNPVASPYKIIYLTLNRGRERSELPPIRFRPWLQAFRDYAFDKRHFTGQEIRDQIDAAEKFGSNGWMLWNPRNIYTKDGLKKNDDNDKLLGMQMQYLFKKKDIF